MLHATAQPDTCMPCFLLQLTSLDVTSVGLPSEVTHLTCLRLLRHLALHCHAPAPPAAALAAPATGLEVPLPAALPALEFFDYSADRGMQVRNRGAVHDTCTSCALHA